MSDLVRLGVYPVMLKPGSYVPDTTLWIGKLIRLQEEGFFLRRWVEADPSTVWRHGTGEFMGFRNGRKINASHPRLFLTTSHGVVEVVKSEQPPDIRRLFPTPVTKAPSTSDIEAASAFNLDGLRVAPLPEPRFTLGKRHAR